MLKEIVLNTDSFMSSVPKQERKKYGQFFTNETTAIFMASLFNFDLSKPNISILDAGAGTGILSTAVIDRLISEGYNGKIHLTCYETDKLVLPLLELNLKILSSKYGIDYTIIHKNYITSQSFDSRSLFPEEKHEFDYIIGNPPYP